MEAEMKERYMKTGRIPTILFVLTLLVTLCQPAEAKTKKPTVGVIQFSVNVFDENAEIVKKARQQLEKNILKAIKNNSILRRGPHLKDNEKTKYSIKYSDMESPEVTIDPVVKSKTKQNLQNICEKEQLDAVIFGHFQEEDNLLVVIRYYIKGDKIYPPIHQTVTIENLSQTKKKKAIKNISAKLKKKLLSELKTKMIKDATKPTQKKKPAPIQQNQKKKSQIKQIPQSQKQFARLGPLTANQAFKMIRNNGFYCEVIKGKWYNEGMKGLKWPKKSKFPLKRTILTERISKDILETESIGNGPVIKLIWHPSLNYRRFDETEKFVKELNKQKKGGFNNWRIPTLKELLSIVNAKQTKNHFPKEFEMPESGSLVFWTSTQVKKEGTVLNHDKENTAYFIVRSRYVSKKNGDDYYLRIHFLNTEEKKGNRKVAKLGAKAFLLATRSEEPKEPKTVVSKKVVSTQKKEKIPGFDDKLPGFDDNPNPTSSSISPSSRDRDNKNENRVEGLDDSPTISINKTQPLTLNIALFPLYWKGQLSYREEGFLRTLNEKIRKELKSLEQGRNIVLIIKNKSLESGDSISYLKRFHGIFTDRNLSREEKGIRIKNRIMIPLNIDILISIKGKKWQSKAEIFKDIRSDIIDGRTNRTFTHHYISNEKTFDRKLKGTLSNIKNTVKAIIEKYF